MYYFYNNIDNNFFKTHKKTKCKKCIYEERSKTCGKKTFSTLFYLDGQEWDNVDKYCYLSSDIEIKNKLDLFMLLIIDDTLKDNHDFKYLLNILGEKK